jgi:hypothetical protein
LGDVAFVRDALQGVVPAPHRRIHVDVGALARVALDDSGNERGLFEVQLADRLAEVDLRGRFDTVGTVPPVNLVAVQREDLLLRVPFLHLNRDQ